jgi:hypothetical protein
MEIIIATIGLIFAVTGAPAGKPSEDSAVAAAGMAFGQAVNGGELVFEATKRHVFAGTVNRDTETSAGIEWVKGEGISILLPR